MSKEELYRLVARLPEQNIARAKKCLERLVERMPPESAAVPRLGNIPFYIDPLCPECGAALVLADPLNNPDVNENEIWHDEFICPSCRDGIYMDWPESEIKSIIEE
ncbi:MAG: hypothetical protein ACOX5W_11235 [Bacillota bacterium]